MSDLSTDVADESTDEPATDYEDPPMSLWDHLAELRKRLVISIGALLLFAGLGWEFRETILAFMVKPYVEAWQSEGIPGTPMLHFQSPAAAFLAYFKLSLLGGATAATPIISWQVWAFIAPGLYAKEKRYVIPFVAASTFLFIGGGYFGWKLVFPLAFKYLLGMSGDLGSMWAFEDISLTVTPTVMMGDYISFVTRMLLGFGMIFQIPLIAFFLSVAGVINYLHLIRYGRWFVVASFVISAIITPPDVTSQVLMAIPMVVLYIASILLAYLFGKPPTEAQKDAHRLRKERLKLERAVEKKRRKAAKAAEKAEKAEKTAPS